ncbi:MAG TPA: copper resistance CopC family protein [Rhodopila sp.]|nr:copper resistance CopC family protein [Rhodopila sp.]
MTAALAIITATIFPGLAQAHAILEDSSPKVGGTVHAGPIDMQLRYNSRIDQGRSRLVLIRADHTQAPVSIAPGSPPDLIRCHLDLRPGAYTIRWQVLAVDGHITRGDVPFTVTGP